MQDVDRAFHRTARVLAACALGIALLALAGWIADVETLRRPLPSTAQLSPLTAIAVAALALAVLAQSGGGGRAAWAGRACAAFGGGVGFVVGCGHLLGQPVDLNARVFGVGAQVAATTAVMLTVLGAGLFAAGAGRAGGHLARLCALAGGGVGVSGLLGYALGVEFFFGANRTVQMASSTAVAGILVAAGTAALVPGPLLGMVHDRSLGGQFLRTALPPVVAVPVVTALLATAGSDAGLYSPAAAVWIMTLAALLCLLIVVAHVAMRLHAADAQLTADASRLTELARRDPLTGALNRRAFGAEIERAADHLRRYGGTGAVCVIDLDHFKAINDSYGHQAGDEALVRVYRALRGRLRSTDVLGRLGGDEFAALLPHADELTAGRVANELREVVAEVAAELREEGRPSRLGASVGHVPMTGAESAADLLDQADARMYAAKRAARAA